MGTVASFKDFIPDVSKTMFPIRQPLKRGVDFQWLPEHEQTLNKIKEILISEPVLSFYDPTKKVSIQADASSTGLGACLLQDSGPVVYASRALTQTEQRWFQIEKELPAVTFAAEHFHHWNKEWNNWWIVILSSCARLLARAWGWAYTFACLNVTTYCNSFSQTEEVWINETCLKAKIKASAWKTIRKTQYSCYENYFQVFRGFSKKSYPERFTITSKEDKFK